MSSNIFEKKDKDVIVNSFVEDSIELIKVQVEDIKVDTCEVCKDKCLEMLDIIMKLSKKIENIEKNGIPVHDNVNLVKKVSKLEKQMSKFNTVVYNRK
jgi:hypothetical protein